MFCFIGTLKSESEGYGFCYKYVPRVWYTHTYKHRKTHATPKPNSLSPLLLVHFKLGSRFLSLLTAAPMETAGAAQLAACSQAGLAASAAVPGPAPHLNHRAWQVHGLRVEVREPCFLPGRPAGWPPVLMRRVLPPTLTHFSFSC